MQFRVSGCEHSELPDIRLTPSLLEKTMQIQSKLPDVGMTIFAVMTQLAIENNAINLSQGFPDFDADPQLKELVAGHMQAGNNQYAPMQGILALREKIAAKTEALYGRAYDPATEITVTAGATEGLFAAITAVVGPGDEVVIFEPAYDAYGPVIQLNGGKPVYVKMTFPGYRIDWEALKKALTPRTRMIIINSPHNPTGAILSVEDIQILIDIVAGTELLILSDEVYEHILFDGHRHESMIRYPELAARSFVISSFGKTYHTTGWKVGYCLAPKVLSGELQKIHQFLTFAVNTPVQFAYAEFLENRAAYLELSAFYQKKRDLFLSLVENSRFKALPCSGTYFQMLDYSDISDAPDVDFARTMTVEHKVAAIPPSAFYHDNSDDRVLRFCFAKTDKTLKEAAEKLCRI
jgi:methionine aminotransferase